MQQFLGLSFPFLQALSGQDLLLPGPDPELSPLFVEILLVDLVEPVADYQNDKHRNGHFQCQPIMVLFHDFIYAVYKTAAFRNS